MVLGAENLYVGVFFLSMIPVFFISLLVGGVRRARRRRQSDLAQGVDVYVPQPGESNNARDPRTKVRMRALLPLVLGLWAAGLSAGGEPVLGPIAAVILLEFSFVGFRSSMIVGGVVSDDVLAARVGPAVAELCRRARCVAPRIMLRDDLLRVAGVVRVKGRITIVLSRPFTERVNEEELAALLAHEVIHIARGDLNSSRRRAVMGVLGGYGLAAGTIAAITIPIVAAFPILVAAFLVGVMSTHILLSPLSRWREARADLEGAQLSEDPRALARALAAADAASRETRRRLYGRPSWNWLLLPVTFWRRLTHPPTARRIARLEAMA